MDFFSREFDPNVRFDMYTSMHLLMLAFFFTIVILFFIFKDRIAASPKEKTIRLSFAGVFIALQLFIIIQDAFRGVIWIPLHLCSISYLLTIALLITENDKIFRYVFFTGIIGGIVTFAIPELYHHGWNRFRFYEFIITHSAIILVSIYYLTSKKREITMKDAIRGIIITNILGFAMIPVNLLLDVLIAGDKVHNFMFVMGPPPDVEDVFGTYPWHLLSFELVLLVSFFGIYYVARLYQNKQKAA